jgi:hypothetical protein
MASTLSTTPSRRPTWFYDVKTLGSRIRILMWECIWWDLMFSRWRIWRWLYFEISTAQSCTYWPTFQRSVQPQTKFITLMVEVLSSSETSELSTRLHCATSRKTDIFEFIFVRFLLRYLWWWRVYEYSILQLDFNCPLQWESKGMIYNRGYQAPGRYAVDRGAKKKKELEECVDGKHIYHDRFLPHLSSFIILIQSAFRLNIDRCRCCSVFWLV